MRNFPAFPSTSEHGLNSGMPGMGLRDYFAAKALQALLHEAKTYDGSWHIEAKAAYEIADEMLKARAA